MKPTTTHNAASDWFQFSLGAVATGVAMFFALEAGVFSSASGGPGGLPVVLAPAGADRMVPEDRGGVKVPYQELEVYSLFSRPAQRPWRGQLGDASSTILPGQTGAVPGDFTPRLPVPRPTDL